MNKQLFSSFKISAYHWSFSVVLVLILSFPLLPTYGLESTQYAMEKKSQIDWENQNVEKWLDFKRVEARQELKDSQPEWENILLEKNRAELVGRVIDCIGVCRSFKGLGFNHSQFRSGIREGDEFSTIGNSYAWIYLFDGTIVRVSPDSSISFKEINIGKTEIFLHARINYGNILWLSRESQKLIEHNDRETDTYFLPLSLFDANQIQNEKEVDESDLFALLDVSKDNLNHVKRLNSLIEENNASANKKRTFVLLVAPNGSVSGYEPMLEFIVLVGGKSYIKKRTRKSQGYSKESENPALTFYFRGFQNQITIDLPDGKWMEVERNGRLIEPCLKPEQFGFGELMSKRITTIMIARELFFKSYSFHLFDIDEPFELAKEWGYRRWGKLKIDQKVGFKSDMSRRFSFLLEYTRRLETSNILNANKLSRKLNMKGDKLDASEYNNRFYKTALATYLNNVEIKTTSDSDREVLNSTTKKYWKMIHAKR